ncbi:hypothetical protein HD806DRAFT_105365 [Xylariaceae sp. AK1471]|nr:hypothetical protein HD806DRAFT_105365 [Xylariaceae sp. AK1471]
MPPRKPSKTASANQAEAKGILSATGVPQRMTRSYHTRIKNISPENATSSGDELNARAETPSIHHAKADDEEVLDEIVVSTLQNTSAKGDGLNGQPAVASNSVETPKQLRPGSRASSNSKSSSAGKTPTRRGTPIKKQDFEIAAAAVADDEEDELAAEEPTPKKLKVIAKSTQLAAFRKGRSKWDNPDEMLTNPKSPLVNTKLRDLLCSAKAWDILTHEEKEQILAKFPDEAEVLDPGTPNARPNVAALRNNNNFRHDVARYQEGLGKGFHDPEWIQQAQAAHRARQLGFYDEFMAADFEEKWDMPMPGQSQTAPVVNNRDRRHEVDDTSEGQMNGASVQSASSAQSEYVATQSHCTDDAMHENLMNTSVQDRQDNQEGTDNDKVALAGDMSKAENKGADPPLEDDVKQQGRLAQVEGATTQASTISTISGGQQHEDPSHNTVAPHVSSLPDMMEGVEQQCEKERAETTKIQQGAAVKELEKPKSTDIQNTTVESTRIKEKVANEVQQQPNEKNVQSDSNAGRQLGIEQNMQPGTA